MIRNFDKKINGGVQLLVGFVTLPVLIGLIAYASLFTGSWLIIYILRSAVVLVIIVGLLYYFKYPSLSGLFMFLLGFCSWIILYYLSDLLLQLI